MKFLKNAIAWVEGNLRYKMYTSNFQVFMRFHIKEQIDYRLKLIRPECQEKGSCVECGCNIPALQMASKKCGGECYPPMLSRSKWKKFKEGKEVRLKGTSWRLERHMKTSRNKNSFGEIFYYKIEHIKIIKDGKPVHHKTILWR